MWKKEDGILKGKNGKGERKGEKRRKKRREKNGIGWKRRNEMERRERENRTGTIKKIERIVRKRGPRERERKRQKSEGERKKN